MAKVSMAEARSRLAALVRLAEGGQAVHITRRGRAVVVLLSEAENARLTTGRLGLLAYTLTRRAEARQAGLALFSDADWSGLRDQGDRPTPDMD